MKTISAEAVTPGSASGSVTRVKVRTAPSPRSRETSIRERSIFSRLTKIGRIANGAKAWASVTTTAVGL